MGSVASRDLRNHTADVLRRVSEGEPMTITVHGEAIAELRPVRAVRRRSVPAVKFLARLRQADPGLRDELREMDQSAAELGPIR